MITRRRLGIGGLAAFILSLALVTPALAGGWTAVALDRVPTDARAGQAFTLGFMVRQHGVTPINSVTPVLRARNAATGESLIATAHQDGPVGHFVVDLTFPAAGDWRWSVTPQPFPEVDLGGVTILAGAAPAPQAQAAPSPAEGLATARSAARWLGVSALFVAIGLLLWSQRAALVRGRPVRAR